MKKVLLIVTIAVILAGISTVKASELTVLNEMNRVRAEAGLHPLQLTYIEGTRASAVRQKQTNRLGHPLPVPSGVGEICAQVGEPIRAVAAWMRSSAHRAIMMCKNRTHVDIAVEGQYVVARISRGTTRTVTREWETLPSGTVIQTRTVERTIEEPGSRVPRLASGQDTPQVRTYTTQTQRAVLFPRVRLALRGR